MEEQKKHFTGSTLSEIFRELDAISLALDDGGGSLLKAELFSPTREHAARLAEGFRARPERALNDLLDSLLEEEVPSQVKEDTQ